jgi:hypothetical protein
MVAGKLAGGKLARLAAARESRRNDIGAPYPARRGRKA